MTIKQTILCLAIACLSLPAPAQVSTIQFKLQNGTLKRPVKNSNVKVTINDTLDKKLITNDKGETGFIELPDGTYNLSISVDPYKERVVKDVKVSGARGKHLRLRLRKA